MHERSAYIYHDQPESDEVYLASRRSRHAAEYQSNQMPDPRELMSRSTAAFLLGEVLYAARMPDGLIKIGYTKNLRVRLNHLPGYQLLAIKPGTRTDETHVHRALTADLHHGQEWYHPNAPVLAVVNEWRVALGRPALTPSDIT